MKALGSEWVRRVWASVKERRVSGFSGKQAPIKAVRIQGPLPAEKTPDFCGGYPSQRRRMARAVAKPVPAGKPRSHQRSSEANARVKRGSLP
jgi:hypothetical protein